MKQHIVLKFGSWLATRQLDGQLILMRHQCGDALRNIPILCARVTKVLLYFWLRHGSSLGYMDFYVNLENGKMQMLSIWQKYKFER